MNKQNKFMEFLRSKGFYTALFTCMFAVLAIAAFVSIRNINAITKLSQGNAEGGTYSQDGAMEPDDRLAAADIQNVTPYEELAAERKANQEKAKESEGTEAGKTEVKVERKEQETKQEAKPQATEPAKDTPKTNETAAPKEQANEQATKEEASKKAGETKNENAETSEAKSEATGESSGSKPKATEQSPAQTDVGAAVGFTSFADGDTMNWPLDGAVVMEFSMDHTIYDKTLDQYRTNSSICISAEAGTQVKAAADGKVSQIKIDPRMGYTVVLDHGNGWKTHYAQLQETILVKEGQQVKAGEAIGGVGTPTKYGVLLGPHLEFVIDKDDVPQNPQLVLAK